MDNSNFSKIINYVQLGKSPEEKLKRFEKVVNDQKMSVENFLEIAQAVDFKAAIYDVNFIERYFSYSDQALLAGKIITNFLATNYEEIGGEKIVQLCQMLDYDNFVNEDDEAKKRSVSSCLKAEVVLNFVSLKRNLTVEEFINLISSIMKRDCNLYRLKESFAVFLYNNVEKKLEDKKNPDDFSDIIQQNIEIFFQNFPEIEKKNQILCNILECAAPDIVGEKLLIFLMQKLREFSASKAARALLLDLAAHCNCRKEFFVDLWSIYMPNFSRQRTGADSEQAGEVEVDFLKFVKFASLFMQNSAEKLKDEWFLREMLAKITTEKFGIFFRRARMELISSFVAAQNSEFSGPESAATMLKMYKSDGTVTEELCQKMRINSLCAISQSCKFIPRDLSQIISGLYGVENNSEKILALRDIVIGLLKIENQNCEVAAEDLSTAIRIFEFVKNNLASKEELAQFLNLFSGTQMSLNQSSPYSFKAFFIDWAQIDLDEELFFKILQNESDENKKIILDEILCSRPQALSDEVLLAAEREFTVLTDIVNRAIQDRVDAQYSSDDLPFEGLSFTDSGFGTPPAIEEEDGRPMPYARSADSRPASPLTKEDLDRGFE